MPFVYGDRVKETSLSTGTGSMTLGGATAGFQSFSAGVGIGNETFYGIVNTIDNAWEMGRGTVGAGTLSRDIVFSSSNSNNLVDFTVGDKIVYTTVPAQFFAGALDAPAHELVDHTVPPLNLLDITAHNAVDHTAAPLSLLTATAHEAVDHTAGPFNLLNTTAHEGVNHTAAPFNLLDAAAHQLIDHTAGPLFLLDSSTHSVVGHDAINNAWRSTFLPQVTVPERTAGTEVALRSFSPADVAAMAGIFGGGGGAGLQVVSFSPATFAWSASNSAINQSTGFAPKAAIAFASFHHGPTNVTAPGSFTSMSAGLATASPSTAYAIGQNVESIGDSNDMATTYAVGSIAGFSGNGPDSSTNYKSAFDLATINITWGATDVTLTPSTTITGNLTLIVFG